MGWGGRRPGAGRKPRPGRRYVTHRARERLSGREPVHVTLRVREDVWNLRTKRCFRVLLRGFSDGSELHGIRLTHFSVQSNHLHLIVEPESAQALSRGMQGLTVRLAKGLNKLMSRKGAVFADRYHAHVLRTPAEVRRTIAYVLGNGRKHAAERGKVLPRAWVDPYAAGPAEDAEADALRNEVEARRLRAIVAPRTWLLRGGFRRRADAGG